MNFEVITTTVDLQDIPSYKTNVTLEGQLLQLSFTWNERLGKRALYIKNSADVCYLQNKILFPNESLELNSNAVFDDLPYSVTLIKTGDQKRVGNIFNWSKDFILCFSRTVDLDVKKLNVVYGVTTPSTPTLPPSYGAWILNQGYEIVGNDIKYTAYKTNILNYYDSFALADLVQTLVKSFHDPDLQQYAAFTTAVEQLIGVVDWVLDLANNRIRYAGTVNKVCTTFGDCSGYENLWESNTAKIYTVPDCVAEVGSSGWWGNTLTIYLSPTAVECRGSISGTSIALFNRVTNPAYDPNDAVEENYLPLTTVAQKVISNAELGEDEVLKLLSEDYIKLVAESIFNTDTAKQFVKLENLIPQLETNKVLRS